MEVAHQIPASVAVPETWNIERPILGSSILHST